jgi:hypothetical protein
MFLVAGKQDGYFSFKNCRDFPAFWLEIRLLFSQPGENYCRGINFIDFFMPFKKNIMTTTYEVKNDIETRVSLIVLISSISACSKTGQNHVQNLSFFETRPQRFVITSTILRQILYQF